MTDTCPNCGGSIKDHVADFCVLSSLMGVVDDRGNLARAQLEQLWGNVDIDRLWDDLGPILDRLEAGDYSK